MNTHLVPGSKEAKEKGCICEDLEPYVRRGKTYYWHTVGCPVHCPIEGWLEGEKE